MGFLWLYLFLAAAAAACTVDCPVGSTVAAEDQAFFDVATFSVGCPTWNVFAGNVCHIITLPNDIDIINTSSADIFLAEVTSAGYFVIENVSTVSLVSFPKLTTISSFVMRNTPSLVSVEMPNLVNVSSILYIETNAILSNISFPALTRIGNPLQPFALSYAQPVLNIIENPLLYSVEFPQLKFVYACLNISGNANLSSISLLNLEKLDSSLFPSIPPSLGIFGIFNNPKLALLAVPNLQKVDALYIGSLSSSYDIFYPYSEHGIYDLVSNEVTSLVFPNLTMVKRISLYANTKLETLSFPLLAAVPSVFRIQYQPILSTFNVPVLSSVQTLHFSSNAGPGQEVLSFPALASAGSIELWGNAVPDTSFTTSLDFPLLTTVASFVMQYFESLTTIVLPSLANGTWSFTTTPSSGCNLTCVYLPALATGSASITFEDAVNLRVSIPLLPEAQVTLPAGIVNDVNGNCDPLTDAPTEAPTDAPTEAPTELITGAPATLSPTTLAPTTLAPTAFNPCAGLADGTICPSLNPCTLESYCVAETCIETPVLCVALDQCHTAGTCNPATGICSTPVATGAGCDDGNACTTGDTCDAQGVCIGTTLVANGTACVSGNTCVASSACSAGLCTDLAFAANGTSCDDGNPCTESDVCTGGGTCVGTIITSCGTCDPPFQCSCGVCICPNNQWEFSSFTFSGTSSGIYSASGQVSSCVNPGGQKLTVGGYMDLTTGTTTRSTIRIPLQPKSKSCASGTCSLAGFLYNNTLYDPPTNVFYGGKGPLVHVDSNGLLFSSGGKTFAHFISRDCGVPCAGSPYVLTLRLPGGGGKRKRDAGDVIIWGSAEFTPLANTLGTE